MLALQASVMSTVFGFGLAAGGEDLLYLWRRPRLLGRSLLAVFVLMPGVAVAIVALFSFPHTTEVVLIALAMSPVPPLLPMQEGRAGGHLSYGLGLMVVLSATSIVATPLAQAMKYFFGRPVAIGAWAIALVAMRSTLGPLAAGMLVRAWSPSLASRLARPVWIVGNILLPAAVVMLVAGAFSLMWAAIGNGTLLALALFTVAGLAIGHLLGGPSPDHAVVLALSTACRHPAIALAIATTSFPDRRFGATVLLYMLVNLIAGLPYLAWQRRRTGTSAPAAS